jgi:hypothetical protein
MQTFMPGGIDFDESAKVLDVKRLNKQGLESYQILRVNAGLTKGWRNHPACLMWKGHESSLLDYTKAIYREISNRGYKTDLLEKIEDVYDTHFTKTSAPQWLNNDSVKITHRGRLFIKFPEHYPQYQYESEIYTEHVCCDRCSYYWPTHIENKVSS